jgi:ABC-type uncharacterized transport system substrate-binding protein
MLLLMALPVLADAVVARIDIVVPANNPNLADMAGGIEHALTQRWPNIPVTVARNDNYSPSDAANTLVVAMGDSNLPWLFRTAPQYAYALAFNVNSALFNNGERRDNKITALYRDQPLVRQLHLAKLLIPNLQRAATIHSAGISYGNIEQLQRNSGVQITDAILDTNIDWAKTLSQLMRDNDVLVGVDDPRIYNSENIRSILLTTYRHGKVLIGPSRPFVNAGSLASCYTASEQYLQQLLTMVAAIVQEHRVPRAQFPKAYRVAVNTQVAASLGWNIPDEKVLTAMLLAQLGECGDGC